MKKRVTAIGAVVVLVASAIVLAALYVNGRPANGTNLADGEFWYSPVDNPIYYRDVELDFSGQLPETFSQLETGAKFPGGATVICSVAGPSVNRIIYPPQAERSPDMVYGDNHVITPVTIEKVIYAGEEIVLKKGETINIIEPYYYVTTKTPDDLRYTNLNSIVSTEYEPMERGKVYLVFLHNMASERYYYKDEPVLSVMGHREGVYCLTDIKTHQGGNRTLHYDEMWREALDKYGADVKAK